MDRGEEDWTPESWPCELVLQAEEGGGHQAFSFLRVIPTAQWLVIGVIAMVVIHHSEAWPWDCTRIPTPVSRAVELVSPFAREA